MSEESDLATLSNEVFKTRRQADDWLLRPHPMLDGNAPLDAALSVTGYQRVVDILIAIKYGSLA